jgi:DNA-binding PadR family transcriptional regulator
VPLHHAVLALLSDGPSYGYEIKTLFEEAIGPQWGGLNIGHLYQILDRLERDGHLSRSHVSQASRPDKTLYTLTPNGERELREWAGEPCSRSGYRDELFLKLLAASRLGEDALARLTSAQRGACLADIAALTRLRSDHSDDPLVALLIDAAIAHTKADLQVVDSAADRLAPIAHAHRSATSERTSSAGVSRSVPPRSQRCAGPKPG